MFASTSLWYTLEVCNLSKRNNTVVILYSQQIFMKLFNTNNMHIINTCQLNFAFELPSVILPKLLIKFDSQQIDQFMNTHH